MNFCVSGGAVYKLSGLRAETADAPDLEVKCVTSNDEYIYKPSSPKPNSILQAIRRYLHNTNMGSRKLVSRILQTLLRANLVHVASGAAGDGGGGFVC